MNKKIGLGILAIVFFLVFSLAKSFAQNTGYDMTVSPVFFDLTGNWLILF